MKKETKKDQFYLLLLKELPGVGLDGLKAKKMQINLGKAAKTAGVEDRVDTLNVFGSWLEGIGSRTGRAGIYEVFDPVMTIGDVRKSIMAQLVPLAKITKEKTRKNTVASRQTVRQALRYRR